MLPPLAAADESVTSLTVPNSPALTMIAPAPIIRANRCIPVLSTTLHEPSSHLFPAPQNTFKERHQLIEAEKRDRTIRSYLTGCDWGETF